MFLGEQLPVLLFRCLLPFFVYFTQEPDNNINKGRWKQRLLKNEDHKNCGAGGVELRLIFGSLGTTALPAYQIFVFQQVKILSASSQFLAVGPRFKVQPRSQAISSEGDRACGRCCFEWRSTRAELAVHSWAGRQSWITYCACQWRHKLGGFGCNHRFEAEMRLFGFRLPQDVGSAWNTWSNSWGFQRGGFCNFRALPAFITTIGRGIGRL